ncbi:MAG: choice-of-anchor D domain-containing protein, partial [Bacteroidales bacterium]
PAYCPLAFTGYSINYNYCGSFITHPITTGVSYIESSLYAFTFPQGSGVSLGTYQSGDHVAAYNPDKPIVAINVFPYNGYWGGDFIQMISNTIDWLAENYGSWLSVDQYNFSLTPGSSQDIALTFDATTLTNGVYNAEIKINSNAASAPHVIIPAQLSVSVGLPHISLSTELLEFGLVPIGENIIQTITVSNTGYSLLYITEITFSNPDFSLGNGTLNINPGDSVALEIKFAPSTTGMVTGIFTIFSNDPDQPEVSIDLSGSAYLEAPQNLIANVVGHDVTLTWDQPFNNPSKGLLGYNIYKDNSLLDYTTNSTFSDIGVFAGGHQYQVSALYDEGESALTPEVSVLVGAPNIVVNPISFSESLIVGASVTREMMIANSGDLPLTFDANIGGSRNLNTIVENSDEAWEKLRGRMNADGLDLTNSEIAPGTHIGPIQYTDAIYGLQFEYPCGNATGETGIETDGSYIYTTLWNGTQFCKYNIDGTFICLFSVPGTSACRDLAYDGTYFYGAAANTTVFQMDFNTNTLIGTITAPTATRAIAYDDTEDGFYSNNWSTLIVLYNRSGATLNTIPTTGDENYYGFAYQPVNEGNPDYLWGYSQKTGTSLNMLYKLNLQDGTVAESFDMLTILNLPTLGSSQAGGLYMFPDLIEGTWTLGGLVQNICLWGVEMGTTGPPPTVDVGVTAFISPVSGLYLGNETVKITVKNFGTNSASNIPVSYTINGGAAVNGTLVGPLAGGASTDFTFPGTVNCVVPGATYALVGCTALAGDLNVNNNCKTVNVTNVTPVYCDASTTTHDEYIAHVSMGLINNSSGWQGGVADYTEINTEIEAGTSQDVVITNGTPWTSDIVYIWVDWDKSYTFDVDEVTMLTNVDGTGASFTGSVTVPAFQTNGDYRMRIRMTYSTFPTPCGNASYGEIEDYTIVIKRNWLILSPTTGNILPGDSAMVDVTFDATVIAEGTYNSEITMTSNDPNEPIIQIPVMLIVTGIPNIELSQTSLNFGVVFTGQQANKTFTISNNGTGNLNINNILSNKPAFTVNNSNFILPPGTTREIIVTFNPKTSGIFNGTLTISSNDPDQTSVDILLTGQGLIAPEISVFPTNLSKTMPQNEVALQQLVIGNIGGSNLMYNVTENDTWLSVSPLSGTIAGGNTNVLDVSFNANSLLPGNYNTSIKVNSNDPVTPVIMVAVSLTVFEPLNVLATATPPDICTGNSTHLNAVPHGGFGNYSYSWTSNPSGFSSILQNPIVSPVVNTTYYVNVSDGHDNASSSVTVTIYENETPSAVFNMLPANNTWDLSVPINFSWGPSTNTSGYDLYVWHSIEQQPTSPVASDITQINYLWSGSGSFSYGDTCKWRVVAKNPCFQTPGPIQMFSLKGLPDLHATGITNSQPIAGQSFTISWTVQNDGNGETPPGTIWLDRVWLCPDLEVRVGEPEDILLGQFQNVSYLDPNENYIQTQQIQLPANLIGTYFLYVITDALDAFSINWPPSGPPLPYNPPPYFNSGFHGGSTVQEYVEGDNFFYKEITFTVPPLPDLQVISIIPPTNVFSGQATNLTWTVKNKGDRNTNTNSWSDRVYFSPDTILNAATAVNLGTFSHTGILNPDSLYVVTKSVTVPPNIFGTYYFYVKTDINNTVFEHVYENNNTTGSDSVIVFLTPPPDLVVTDINLPGTASNNDVLTIGWTVENQGATTPIVTSWTDGVYLSASPDYDLTDAYYVGSALQNITLLPDSSYFTLKSLGISENFSGPYYIYVHTDFNDNVFEYLNENNNILRSDTPIEIINPDLIVTNIVIPSGNNSSQPFNIQWSIKNNGPGKVFNQS